MRAAYLPLIVGTLVFAGCGGGGGGGTSSPPLPAAQQPASPATTTAPSTGTRPTVSAAAAATGTGAIPSGQALYVLNLGTRSVTEYAASSPGTPLRTIPLAGTPSRLDVSSTGFLAVLEGTSVEVFAPHTTTPLRTIGGSMTGITSAAAGVGITSTGQVVVQQYSAVYPGTLAWLVFAPGANGNVAPAKVTNENDADPQRFTSSVPYNLATNVIGTNTDGFAVLTAINGRLWAADGAVSGNDFIYDNTGGPVILDATSTLAASALPPAIGAGPVVTLNPAVGGTTSPKVIADLNLSSPWVIQGSNTTLADVAGAVEPRSNGATVETVFVADQRGGCATGDIAVFQSQSGPNGQIVQPANPTPVALIGAGTTGIDQPIGIALGPI